MWLAFVVLLSASAQDKNDAEQLFRQTEAKVSKAKALDLSFDIKIEWGKGGKLKGTLASMSANKARLEMSGEVQGQPFNMLMVSDGARIKMTGLGPAEQPQDTPKKLDEMIRAMATRAGVFLPIILAEPVPVGQKPKEFNVDEQLRVSEFRLGKKEKLGEREAQVVEYKLTTKTVKEPFSVSVWLDPNTNLPLKRVLTGKQEDERITVTETYTKMVLDKKFDEKKFELPK
jgi:outer membrane lipoprotein-sorting protein